MTTLQKTLLPGTVLHEKLKLTPTDQKHTYLAVNLSTNESQVFISAAIPQYFSPQQKAKMANMYSITVLYAGHVAPVNMTPAMLADTPIDSLQKVIENAIIKVKNLGLKPADENEQGSNSDGSSGEQGMGGQEQDVQGTRPITSYIPES